jgi:hypothetical protein
MRPSGVDEALRLAVNLAVDEGEYVAPPRYLTF